jgi:hypothetical protein
VTRAGGEVLEHALQQGYGQDKTETRSRAARSTQERQPWRDLIPFYEYFHGDNGAGLGASHQTGWTGLVANLIIDRSRSRRP